MPHFWNNIWVVTKEDILPWYNNKLKNIQQEVSRSRKRGYGIQQVQVGGNGRQALYAYDSLPAEIREALGDPRKPEHLMELFYKTDADAVRFYTNHKIDGVHLRLALQEEYITNASVLRACVELKAARERERKTKGISCKGIMTTILNDAQSFNTTLKQKYSVAHTLPSSEKRFKQTFNDFVKPFENYPFNYPSLISGKVRNQNSRKVIDDVLNLLNALFAGRGTKPTRTEVSRCYDGFLQGYIEVINEETGELYDPKEFKPISDATIIRYLGSWSEAIGAESRRSGDRQRLMGKFKPYHSLEQPSYAGSIISVDDRQPPFWYEKGKRPWFYMGIDLGSEAFVCWVYGKSKEGIITEFYRQLVRNYTEWGINLPLELEAELSLNASFTSTFLREGAMFDNVRIEANNARGKRIERYFGNLRYSDEKDREGWLARPHARNEANQPGAGKEVIIPYSQIIDNGLRDVYKWNNQPHSKYPDKSRWRVFLENQNPNTKPTNWRAILPSLGYCTKTSVGMNAIMRLQNEEFLLGEDGKVLTGQALIDAMELVGGETVTVYWLDDNIGKVMKALIYLNDTCICEAVPKPVYNRATAERTPQDSAARQVMSAYVSTIEAYRKEKMRSIEEVVVINKKPIPFDDFQMPGMRRFEAFDEKTHEAPEILPDILEDEDAELVTAPNNTFIKSLKDRI